MKEILRYILACVISLIAFTACDVHEFPEDNEERIPFLLHLDFNTEMPLHKEIQQARSRGLESPYASDNRHDIRYKINAYRIDEGRGNSRAVDATFVFTKSDLAELNYTACLELPEGDYDFKIWADYVNAGSTSDNYYDTHDYSEIILADRENHSGSNNYRDAFRGYASGTVKNPARYTGDDISKINNEATADMRRPMGKFKFVSTDMNEFLNIVLKEMQKKGRSKGTEHDPTAEEKAVFEEIIQQIKRGEYYVIFRYNMFMPCSFNMFTDKPADSWTGMSFKSRMEIENNDEITLGFDYIFVNGTETTLSISLEVYNGEDELLSSTNPINVPIARSKLTVVKGEFLTSKATGGVSINPGYDGEDYNIEIQF